MAIAQRPDCKKKKKYSIQDYIWLHICANLWVKIPNFGGSEKFDKDFENGTFGLKALPDTPKVLHPSKNDTTI